MRLRQLIFCRQQQAIFVEHFSQADRAAFVGLFRRIACALMGIDLVRQFTALLFQLCQGHDGIFDVFRGAQHRQAIPDQRFAIGAFGARDVRIDTAKVEQSPTQAETGCGLKAACREQAGGAQTVGADVKLTRLPISTDPALNIRTLLQAGLRTADVDF